MDAGFSGRMWFVVSSWLVMPNDGTDGMLCCRIPWYGSGFVAMNMHASEALALGMCSQIMLAVRVHYTDATTASVHNMYRTERMWTRAQANAHGGYRKPSPDSVLDYLYPSVWPRQQDAR